MNQEGKIDLNDIRLMEIVEVDGTQHSGSGKHLRITLGYFDGFGDPMMQATWYLPRKEWPDDSILPVAKNWLHHLCRSIANSTTDWAIQPDRFDELKKPAARKKPLPPSSNVPS